MTASPRPVTTRPPEPGGCIVALDTLSRAWHSTPMGRVEIIRREREFTAAEAASAAGVALVQQRNWRRRGLLPPNASGRKGVLYELTDVCQLAIMQALSDGGLSVKAAADLSRAAAFALVLAVERRPGALAYDPPALTAEQREQARFGWWSRDESDGATRYVFAPTPTPSPASETPPPADLYMIGDLAEIEARLPAGAWSLGVLVNLDGLAAHIVRAVPGPLVTYRVEWSQ